MCIIFKIIHCWFLLLVICVLSELFVSLSSANNDNTCSKSNVSANTSVKEDSENQSDAGFKRSSNNLQAILDDVYKQKSAFGNGIGRKITRNVLSTAEENLSFKKEDAGLYATRVHDGTATHVVAALRTQSSLPSSQFDNDKYGVSRQFSGRLDNNLETDLNEKSTGTFHSGGDVHQNKDDEKDFANLSLIDTDVEAATKKVVIEPPLDSSQEDIPSFREWTEKHLAEKEKERGDDNATNVPNNGNQNYKMRNKNYASLDCGAKILATNPEAKSAGSLLSASRDEYLLSACNSKIWFIVELCEAVQLKRIELANFELFSSSPKEYSVHIADRFPSRDWTMVGQFTALDVKSVQSFDVQPDHFTKYIKVEFYSHYGKEHYCPISLFRVYGTSEFEALEPDDGSEELGSDTADSDYDVNEPIISDEEGQKKGLATNNIFGSAKEAVINIVKKAAEVLVNSPSPNDRSLNTTNVSSTAIDHHTISRQKGSCVTPRYVILCRNCKEDFFHRLYQLLSCYLVDLGRTLQRDLVWKPLIKYNVCLNFGITPFYLLDHASALVASNDIRVNELYVMYLLPRETIAALCNFIAISKNRVKQNVTMDETLLLNQTLKNGNSSAIPPIYNTLYPIHVNPATELKPSTSPFKIIEHTTSGSTQPQDSENVVSHIRPTKTFSIDSDAAEHDVQSITTSSIPTYVPIFPDIVNNEQIKVSLPDESENPKDVDHTAELPEDSMSLDSLISELEKTENTQQAAINSAPTATPKPIVQKESVFIRLANRIKALERNMSLSGQYLEELSKRYKKQVEDMQRVLSEVVGRESKKADEFNALVGRIMELTVAVDTLVAERESWSYKALMVGEHSLIVLLEIAIFIGIVCLCRGIPRVEISKRKFSLEWRREKPDSQPRNGPPALKRRQSLDDLKLIKPPHQQHKRRPSEEALKIDGATHQELLIYDTNRSSKAENRRKKRKRKELLVKSNANAINLETGGNNLKRKLTPVKSSAPLSRSASASEIDEHSWGRIVDHGQRYFLQKENICADQKDIGTIFKTATSIRTKRVPNHFNGTSVLSPVYDVSSDQDSSVPSTPIKEKKMNGIKKIVKKFF